MTLVREFNLYLTAGRTIPLVINVNQFDSGEQWAFTIYKEDGTQYIPSTGAIVGIKSDGLGIINSGTVVDGKVVINETQQMTAAVGKATFELTIDSGTHGTANFVVLVEEKPGNNADLSDSDLSLIQEALNAVNPLPTGGTVGQVLTKTAQGSAWSDAGTPTQAQVAEAVSDWADENITVETGVVIDQSLSVSGAAADAKKTGDEISDLKSQIETIEEEIEGGTGSGLTDEVKQALMDVVNHIGAWTDGNAQTYITNLYNALYAVTAITLNTNSISMQSIGATTQLTATTTPSGGAVTWSSSDTSVATVDSTGLVTSVGYGNATITATAGSVSATCSVVIAQATLLSISAVYTQSGTVKDTDSLDSLKSDLVVTATWNNSTTSTVDGTDYTLTGTLEEGTSTITVSYGGQTATFNVTVTHIVEGWYYPFNNSIQSAGTKDFGFTGVTNYVEGVNDEAYYHEVATEGTASTDTYGINATGLTDLPDLSGDFTISFWFKAKTAKRGHPFGNNKYIGNAKRQTLPSPQNVASGWTVSATHRYTSSAGLCIGWASELLYITLFTGASATGGGAYTVTFPSTVDTTNWHHYALTRDNGTVRFFVDGNIIFTAEISGTIYFSSQVCVGNFFAESSGSTALTATSYSDYVDDLYIAESCKWSDTFNPSAITY